MDVKNIAYYPDNAVHLKNEFFNVNHPTNITGNLDRWAALRRFLAKRGIEINTYDIYKNPKEIDLWLFIDPGRKAFEFIIRHRISPRKLILMLVEPPVGNPRGWRYLHFYSWLFKIILTWNPELAKKGKKYARWYFPTKFDPAAYNHYRSNSKKNLCLMMHSNKMSKVHGELYSLRRKIIRYFEKRGDKLLELFGYGWNDKKNPWPFFTNLYKGTSVDKRETLSNYYFTFCIDNSIVPGYITYDPFISMATATVPIYLPMPDSLEYIPENTFINYNNFKNLDELVLYLKSIVETEEYEKYRENGWKFINSEKFRPFTVERFCEDVYRAVQLENY